MKISNPLLVIGACLLHVLSSVVCEDEEPAREINANGTCTPLKCKTKDKNSVILQYMSGHAIDNHTISTNRTWHSEIVGDEAAGLKGCIAVPSCITVVVGKEEGKCWLYEGDDVYVHPETIQPKQGYKIVSLGNGVCKQQPCNNGKCIPNFDGSGKFTCSCDPGYRGERCEIEGADVHFSFDGDTSHGNTKMTDFKMNLVQGKLIRVPDRRGRVLFVREGESAVKMEMDKAPEYGAWMNEPWVEKKTNLTVTFWLKMDPSIVTDAWRTIINLSRWWLSYNGKEKVIKAFIASDGDPTGATERMNVDCTLARIQRWNFITLAMGTKSGMVKLYIDGEMCDSKDVSAVKPTTDPAWAEASWPNFLFKANKGISLIDELKFYKSYPTFDDAVHEMFLKEKKEFMS